MIGQILWCVMTKADLPARCPRCNRLMSKICHPCNQYLQPYLVLKGALLEFRFCHDTLQATKFTPLRQYQLVKFCICAEFLDTNYQETFFQRSSQASSAGFTPGASLSCFRERVGGRQVESYRSRHRFERSFSGIQRVCMFVGDVNRNGKLAV